MTDRPRNDHPRALRNATVFPTSQDSKVAAEVRDAMRGAPRERRRKCAVIGPGGLRVELPHSIATVLAAVATSVARGEAVFVSSLESDLTTQDAAAVLGVSRQYVVRLIDTGKIPATKTGTHRRVSLEAVVAFKERRDRDRRASLDELTRITQGTKGGYPGSRR